MNKFFDPNGTKSEKYFNFWLVALLRKMQESLTSNKFTALPFVIELTKADFTSGFSGKAHHCHLDIYNSAI